MAKVGVRVSIRSELLREIDELVGKGGRSAFFTRALENAFRDGGVAEDMRDVIAARRNLRAKNRIPWNTVKASAGKRVRKQLKAG